MMCRAVEAELGKFPHVTVAAKGGMFQWVDLPGINTQTLLPKAIEAGVTYVPGARFFANESGVNSLRLSFASATAEQIGEGVRRLARTLAG